MRHRSLTALSVASAFFIGGCSSGSSPEVDPTQSPDISATSIQDGEVALAGVDILKTGTWNYMPGVIVNPDETLTVHPTNRAILSEELDGGPDMNPPYTADPPVNVYGTRLDVPSGVGFGLNARLSDIKGDLTISLLDQPPVRHDESVDRVGPYVDLTVSNYGEVTIKTWDGLLQDSPVIQQIRAEALNGKYDIAITQDPSGTINVKINGQNVTAATPVFSQVWFGINATGDTTTIEELTAATASGDAPTVVDTSTSYSNIGPSPDGLASIAQANGHNQLIGTAVELTELMANPQYAEFVIQNFNEIETEILGKFQTIQPQEGQFEFGELDALVKFANEHNLTVHGHTLVFTEAYPQWLINKLGDPSTTAEQAKQIMITHITTVMQRYNGHNGHGTISEWDVVNEPFDPDDWGEINTQSIWYQAIDAKGGGNYIFEAFKAARAADPNAKLYLNDWGAETDPDRMEAMFNLAVWLHSQGLLDGVGLQSHIDEDTLDDSDAMNILLSGGVKAIIDRYGQADILVRLSEISVAENNNPTMKASVFASLVAQCIQANTNCSGINYWGAANSTYEGRYPYFTGGVWDQDPGDDALTTQDNSGAISTGGAWQETLAVLSANPR